jgi:hypothetical protein
MTETLRTDLNDFLFTSVASDANGMHLTMLSALARSGVDPWDEAARLAALSRESAIRNIVQMLGSVPNGPSPGEQATSMAERLVAQLHPSSTQRVKRVTSSAATSDADEFRPVLFSTLPAPVRRTIYVLTTLFLVAMVFRALGGA